jgi:imidazoleglycerol phosphate synthase glutamine amidotransferase subunit HisH
MKEITADDRKALIDTIATPGWGVIKKIVDNAEEGALEICGRVDHDQRYYQGMLLGIQMLYKDIFSYSVGPRKSSASSTNMDYS